jgi:hypothetical protein
MQQRRVGTFTLGVSLILLGVIIPLMFIFKENALKILQFAPVILLVLGIEVLIYAIRYKDGKLIYDGLSIFMVIMISFVTIGASIATSVVNQVVEMDKTHDQMEKTIRSDLEEIVAEQKLVADVRIYPNRVFHYAVFDKMRLKEDVNCNIDATENNELTKEQVIAKMKSFFEAVRAKDIAFDKMRLTITTPSHEYSYAVYQSQLKNLSASYIEKGLAISQMENQAEQFESESVFTE